MPRRHSFGSNSSAGSRSQRQASIARLSQSAEPYSVPDSSPDPHIVRRHLIDDDGLHSLRLPGGDVTRGVYRWQQQQQHKSRERSQSFDLPTALNATALTLPGGFRRHFVSSRQNSPFFTRNFLEFLTVFGHFAGEDLREDDDTLASPDEQTPFLAHIPRPPTASFTKAVLLLLKSFIGTGVLFLPKAFYNGGLLFSSLLMLFVASISLYCFILLIDTRAVVDGSFGDIGGALYGPKMRQLILASIVISQLGFVSAYTVFTAENLNAFILAVSNCDTEICVKWLILLQLIIFLPLAMVRNISKLGGTVLVADFFILLGLLYLYYSDVLTIAKSGLADVVMFNKHNWTLSAGTACFAFEGIGLLIPIRDAMARPAQFTLALKGVMVLLTILFTSMGALGYMAYGSQTQTVVILNLPQTSKFVNAVQFLYALAILLSTPLQLFPAIRILENGIFTTSGKFNPWIKWQKNIFRVGVVFFTALVAIGGAGDLDKFVALIGSFACVPLMFVYPAMLHYRACAHTKVQKLADGGIFLFGVVVCLLTTWWTIQSWAKQEPGKTHACRAL